MKESWQSGKRYFIVLCAAAFLLIVSLQTLLISDGKATIKSVAIDWLVGLTLVSATIGLMWIGKKNGWLGK